MRQSGPSLSFREVLSLVSLPLAVSAGAEAAAGGLMGLAGGDNARLSAVTLGSALLFAAGATFGHYFDREAEAMENTEIPEPEPSAA